MEQDDEQVPLHDDEQPPLHPPVQNPLSHDDAHVAEQSPLQSLEQYSAQVDQQDESQLPLHPSQWLLFDEPVQPLLQDDLQLPVQLPEHPPLQLLLQLEQVDDFDDPSQLPEQEELHPPLQPLLHDDEHEEPVQPLLFSRLSRASKRSSSSFSQDTIVGSIVTPTKIGSVFLIACLKKSLRLIMSFFILIKLSRLIHII